MTADRSPWIHPRGSLAREGWEAVVDAATPGWEHTGLRVAELAAGEALELGGTGVERIVVPLAGAFTVEHTEHPDGTGDGVTATTELAGRPSVFAGPTDVLYLSSAATGVIRGEGRVAVATSPTEVRRPSRHVAADEVPVELRGAGSASRQVQNLGTPEVLDAARLIVCEVITPAGNWSSYPAHKHDDEVPGRESRLEEIYYFEAAPAAGSALDPAAASALFSVSSSAAGEIELDARVATGDIVLVPFGYHGPAATPPGVDLYYLNVMAGPGPERRWLISDDPAQAGIREDWTRQAVDARLPYGRGERG